MVRVVAIVNWHGSGQEYTAVLEARNKSVGGVYFHLAVTSSLSGVMLSGTEWLLISLYLSMSNSRI